eukprot:SAG11_NODE_8592_length_998_cov_1.080089_1_plen_75_part_00
MMEKYPYTDKERDEAMEDTEDGAEKYSLNMRAVDIGLKNPPHQDRQELIKLILEREIPWETKESAPASAPTTQP